MSDLISTYTDLLKGVDQSYMEFIEDITEDLGEGYESPFLEKRFLKKLKEILTSPEIEEGGPFHIFWAHLLEQLITITQLHEEYEEAPEEADEISEEIFDFWDSHEYSMSFMQLLEERADPVQVSIELLPLLQNQIISFYYLHFANKFVSDIPLLYSISTELGDSEDRVHLAKLTKMGVIDTEEYDRLLPISRIDYEMGKLELQSDNDVYLKEIVTAKHTVLQIGYDKTLSLLSRDKKTDQRLPDFTKKTDRALQIIKILAPDCYLAFSFFTHTIIPIQEDGVVSYSLQALPGISLINYYDRDFVDLIDDLIHENGHHLLNAYLNQTELIIEDSEQIYFSPWRRALRPIRGIYHGVYTFHWGFKLFFELASKIDQVELDTAERAKIIFRALEEHLLLGLCEEQIHHAFEESKILPEGMELMKVIFTDLKEKKNAITELQNTLKSLSSDSYQEYLELKTQVEIAFKNYQLPS